MCSRWITGVQTFGLGISGGKHFIDKNCERLKLARILNDFGMRSSCGNFVKMNVCLNL